MGAVSSAVTVPLSEYLDKDYRPDCEYIDGEWLERNAPAPYSTGALG